MKINLTQIGSSARACLTSGQRGKVLAAFSKAIYLLTETGELFGITTVDSPMHRRCAQISSPLPGLLAGSPFHVQDHRLTVDSDFVFDADDALIWNAPQLNPVVEFIELPSRIHSFFSYLDLSQAKGFGDLIPQTLSFSTTNFTDPILHYAQPLVLDMAHACLDHQPSRIPSLTDKLIGLGAGLTPSGDDFLGGMFFALRTLRDSYPDQVADYVIALEPYRSRTHLISFTLLSDLANGHALAPLHLVINGLVSGEPFETISPFVSQLTSLGHSTGWDELTGLLVGLLAAYQSNYFIPSFQIHPSKQPVYRS